VPTPDNPITPNTYYIVTPASEFVSKAYGDLNGLDLFFYVNETNSLRVVNFNTDVVGRTSYVLAQSAKWVGVLSVTGMIHVYYADITGQLWHIPYQTFSGTFTATMIPISGINNFSVTSTPQTTPPAYMMMTDNGVYHTLYVTALDPTFTTLLAPSARVYNNALNPDVFVTQPTITMHPLDTVNLTVSVQSINQHTAISSVGFYTVAAPGV